MATQKDSNGKDLYIGGELQQYVVDAKGTQAESPAISAGAWTREVAERFADRYLSEDVGQGNSLNGIEADKTGHYWVGRGFSHVTHFGNYAEFFFAISQKYPDLVPEFRGCKDLSAAKIILNQNKNLADLVSEDSERGRTLSALSGAWYWGTHNAQFKNSKDEWKIDGKLNDKASTITWGNDRVDPSQESEFNKISWGVNPGEKAVSNRWENYEKSVKAVLKGGTAGNPFESLRAALIRVGVTTTGRQDYQSGFGLALTPRQAAPINAAPARLLAASGALSEMPDGPDLTAAQEEELWAQAELHFVQLKQSPEEKIMWLPDIRPEAGWLAGAVVAVATVSPAQAAENYAMGVCRTATQSEGAEIRPLSAGNSYLYDYHRTDALRRKFDFDSENTKITLVKAPKHGEVALADVPNVSKGQYHYMPKGDGYIGRDRFVMQVEKDGVKVRLHYLIEVISDDEPTHGPNLDESLGRPNYFCNPGRWKINAVTPDLQSLLSSLGLSAAVKIGTADLAGAAIGAASESSITLDTTAAGHGWYFDYTPYLNEEFLPTSNPNEWVAKPGSEAEGKMDLLTVLLHEYGHALGLDHTADAHDFMAATLQPGVRRTLTVDQQLELMRLAGIFVTPESPSEPYAPTDPGAPLPFTRVIATRSARRAAGLDSLVPQFDTAANPKLANADFASAEGWSTTGDVRFENGTATLSEGTATQTRLNQVFVVNEGDRFLSFTVANAALGDQAYGPDDAFEVALLDANTGLSLLGGTGLTKSDAALNRQADGSEFKVSGISSVANADGSRTYLVDLAGVAAGTVVNLSFDLIGFGKGVEAQNSRLTIRDLRLGVPQTADDAVATAEDAPLVVDALANDLNARQPGFVPVVATGPAHGQVSINADGSFAYTPEKDWFGEDRFTYKLSDGRVDSNLATVVLTVTPVNDVPVALTRTVTLDEDGSATVDLLAGASDVDGDALTAAVTAIPQHGSFTQNADGTWTYAPAADWSGTDSVEFEVSDGAATTASRITFVVNAVNDAPTLGNQSLAGTEDESVAGTLLAMAADVDSTVLAARIISGPAHGQLAVGDDGSFLYTPDADWNGTDRFTYVVNDGELDSAVAEVVVIVAPVNDAPTLGNQSLSGREDEILSGDLLVAAGDIDSTALAARIVDGPAHGQLTLNGDGSFTYTPADETEPGPFSP